MITIDPKTNKDVLYRYDIVEWHKNTYPDATLEEVLVKINDACLEYGKQSEWDKREDKLADIFILCTALFRWKNAISDKILCSFWEWENNSRGFCKQPFIDFERMDEVVNKKLGINKND